MSKRDAIAILLAPSHWSDGAVKRANDRMNEWKRGQNTKLDTMENEMLPSHLKSDWTQVWLGSCIMASISPARAHLVIYEPRLGYQDNVLAILDGVEVDKLIEVWREPLEPEQPVVHPDCFGD